MIPKLYGYNHVTAKKRRINKNKIKYIEFISTCEIQAFEIDLGAIRRCYGERFEMKKNVPSALLDFAIAH